jgi:hypothetical protein
MSLSRKKSLAISGATAALALFGAISQSAAVPLVLDAATWLGSEVCAGQQPCLDITTAGTFSQTYSQDGTFAQVIGVQSPAPSVTATAVSPAGTGVSAVESLIYNVAVIGPAAPGGVKLDFIANETLSATSFGEAITYLSVQGLPAIQHVIQGGNISYSITSSVTVQLDQAVEVNIAVTVGAGTDPASATAFVDPYFFVDPSVLNADQYSIITSDGIGNSPNAATPLPAALPLFAAGLGVMGFLAKRRKRKVVAVA